MASKAARHERRLAERRGATTKTEVVRRLRALYRLPARDHPEWNAAIDAAIQAVTDGA